MIIPNESIILKWVITETRKNYSWLNKSFAFNENDVVYVCMCVTGNTDNTEMQKLVLLITISLLKCNVRN